MLKDLLFKTNLFPVARATYQRIFRPDVATHRARMGAFYSQFFDPGDVVFDVGANLGEYAEVFANEGATVVAIEPNTAFQPRLNALSRNGQIKPVFSAIGAEEGSATLNVCSHAAFSTLAPVETDWIRDSPDYEGVAWTHAIQVPVTTLDALIDEYGTPTFVKIDVEGFEIGVLRGATFRPRNLSFEFGARRLAAGLECLEHLGAQQYEFRPIVGRNYRFATPEWMSYSQAKAWLSDFKVEVAEYGDMFAHRLP
jgi:FkbM family methyltransferase